MFVILEYVEHTNIEEYRPAWRWIWSVWVNQECEHETWEELAYLHLAAHQQGPIRSSVNNSRPTMIHLEGPGSRAEGRRACHRGIFPDLLWCHNDSKAPEGVAFST